MPFMTMEQVPQINTTNLHYGFKTEISVAAIRHRKHVLEAALIGADICTMYFEFMEMLYLHPLTDIVVDQFLKDWAKIPK